jgi:hypothetical protein
MQYTTTGEALRTGKLAEVIGSSGRTYEIRLGKDDNVYCTCWAWKKHRECKHLDEFWKDITKRIHISTGEELHRHIADLERLCTAFHSDPANVANDVANDVLRSIIDAEVKRLVER